MMGLYRCANMMSSLSYRLYDDHRQSQCTDKSICWRRQRRRQTKMCSKNNGGKSLKYLHCLHCAMAYTQQRMQFSFPWIFGRWAISSTTHFKWMRWRSFNWNKNVTFLKNIISIPFQSHPIFIWTSKGYCCDASIIYLERLIAHKMVYLNIIQNQYINLNT